MKIALFQPDIPQNTGTIIRLGACLDVPIDIIEPCGFVFDNRKLKRAGMDYIDKAKIQKFASWEDFFNFKKDVEKSRIVLLSTKSSNKYIDFQFQKNDTLLLGRESKGVPENVHNQVDSRVLIPMNKNFRSINVAVSGAIVLGEALRQTNLM